MGIEWHRFQIAGDKTGRGLERPLGDQNSLGGAIVMWNLQDMEN